MENNLLVRQFRNIFDQIDQEILEVFVVDQEKSEVFVGFLESDNGKTFELVNVEVKLLEHVTFFGRQHKFSLSSSDHLAY